MGQRVAVWPLSSCGRCRACRIGRPNACPQFRLVGIHVDGALAEHLTVAAGQVFPVGDLPPAVAAFCEPMSIAVRALERGRVAEGDTVVALGAGPIGQAVTIGALDRGARVLVTDMAASRLALAAAAGADVLDVGAPDADAVATAREWSGGEGPAVVIDCSGQPAAIADGVAMVAPAGRVVVVGISHERVALPVNAFTEKEIDLLGSTVCTATRLRRGRAARRSASRAGQQAGDARGGAGRRPRRRRARDGPPRRGAQARGPAGRAVAVGDLLAGKAGVVTGAAGGIGRGVALELAREGAAVLVSDVAGAKAGGEETVRLIEAEGGTAAFTVCDVTSAADCAAPRRRRHWNGSAGWTAR